MKQHNSEHQSSWEGEEESFDIEDASVDELRLLESQLRAALARFKERDQASEMHYQQLRRHLHIQLTLSPLSSAWRLLQSPRIIAVTLLCILGLGIIGSGVWRTAWNSAMSVWYLSTSFDQINSSSIPALPHPKNEVKPLPLLPTMLPDDTHGSTYGVITDQTDPNLLTAFVADYRIAGQDVFVYEQPSVSPFSVSGAQTILIGSRQGQIFQNENGLHAIQWYQYGMMCQLTSTLPVEQLVKIASDFQPIQSWDILH